MWNVEERFSQKAIESLAALGFTVGSTRGVVRVEKYGSGAEFRQDTDGKYQLTILPTIMVKGQFSRLWDAGYQKFLLTDEGIKLPALATRVEKSLHLCLAGLRIRWFDPIAEASELPKHLRSAELLRSFGDRWAPFFVTNS